MRPGGWAAARLAGLAAVVAGLLVGAGQLPDRLPVAPNTLPAGLPSGPTMAPVTQTLLGCPGPETEGVSGLAAVPGEAVTVLASTAPVEAMGEIDTAASPGTLSLRAYPADALVGSATTRGMIVSAALTGMGTAEVSATGSLAAGVAAVQTGLRRTGDDRGLQVIPCQSPRSDLWLLGGGGAPTRRERLVVANPGANALTIDVHVHGASGPIASVNGVRVAVPPHGRVGLLIDAIAPGEPSPAVHVTATGGQVTALLEDSWIDGATGRGRDNVGPADGPATDVVIPAVYLNGPGKLRIMVPGSDEALVQSRALGVGGSVPLPSDSVVRVPGGSVRDIDLAGLAPGAYAVQVRSDHPVVAAVVVERRPASTSGQSDLGWVPATPAIPRLAGTPIPAGVTARLLVVGTGAPWSASVFVVGPTGAVTTMTAEGAADVAWTGDLPVGSTAAWVRPRSGTIRAGLSTELTDSLGPLVALLGLEPVTVSTTHVPVREVGR